MIASLAVEILMSPFVGESGILRRAVRWAHVCYLEFQIIVFGTQREY
jgi:hypothetical protein